MQTNRYLFSVIKEWLPRRMVFIGGPRQVGKTHLSKQFIKSPKAYLNWDDLEDRKILKEHKLPAEIPRLVVDEIHKYPRWRTLMKGLYDKRRGDQEYIVTGSARLDHFRKGGDSLFGRYHYLRLHPFTYPEATKFKVKNAQASLLQFGGFPEPLFQANERFAKIWRRERVAKVIHQDLRDLTNLKDYVQMELLADALPSRVGSLLSLNSLAEDLEKSPHTISKWIEILESVYMCYTILPYGPPRIKAVKKTRKLYLWDWSEIKSPGPLFENYVASHLLKYCHFIEDTEGDKMELRYLKDQFGREIDFVILKNKQPLFAVECKHGDGNLSPHISYYAQRTEIPKFYQVHLGQNEWTIGNAHVLPFTKFCQIENLI